MYQGAGITERRRMWRELRTSLEHLSDETLKEIAWGLWEVRGMAAEVLAERQDSR